MKHTNFYIQRIRQWKNIEYKKELLINRSFIGTGSNMFFKTKELKEIGGFDERFLRHQDLEVLIRFLNKNNIIGIDEPLVVKDNSDRINQPDLGKLLKIREFFLDNFKNEINAYEDKNLIYFENYFNLLLNAIKSDNIEFEKILRKKAQKYKNFSINNHLTVLKVRIVKKIKKSRKNPKLNSAEIKLLKEFNKSTKGK